MLDISPEKLLVLAAVAMLVLGPDRLPGLARQAARLRADLRRLTADVDPQTLQAIRDPRAALRQVVDPIHAATEPLRAVVDQAVARGPAVGRSADPAAPGPAVGRSADPADSADLSVDSAGPSVAVPTDPTVN